MRRVNATVTGLVQGVFFRASTRDEARRLGITGTVRNEPDDTVSIQAEGEDGPLEEFVAWCREGPPAAQVTSLEVSEGPVQGYPDFQITF